MSNVGRLLATSEVALTVGDGVGEGLSSTWGQHVPEEEGGVDGGVENVSVDDGDTGDAGPLREIEERSIVSAISCTFLGEVRQRVMEACVLYGGGGSILAVTQSFGIGKRNQIRK